MLGIWLSQGRVLTLWGNFQFIMTTYVTVSYLSALWMGEWSQMLCGQFLINYLPTGFCLWLLHLHSVLSDWAWKFSGSTEENQYFLPLLQPFLSIFLAIAFFWNSPLRIFNKLSKNLLSSDDYLPVLYVFISLLIFIQSYFHFSKSLGKKEDNPLHKQIESTSKFKSKKNE